MLTPEQIDAYAGQMAEPWGELADRILRDMVRRIVKAGRITDTVEWQAYRLEALGASEQYIRRQLQAIAAEIGPQEAAIFAQAMQEADAADRTGAPPEAAAQAPGLGESPEAQQLIEHPSDPDAPGHGPAAYSFNAYGQLVWAGAPES